MPSANLFALNRGEVSALALARVDQEALKLAGEIQVNWQPTKIGPMTMRAGLGHLGGILGDQKWQAIEAVYGTFNSALIELTPLVARFWVDDALVTRVKSGVTIQPFTAWTEFQPENSTVNRTSTLTFFGVTQRNLAWAEGTITVPAPLDGTEFGLRIVVERGNVLVSIGTSSGDEDVLAATRLSEGTHSLAIPANTVGGGGGGGGGALGGGGGGPSMFVRIASDSLALRIVSEVSIEAVGVLTLPTPWTADDIGLIQYSQSIDVIYLSRKTAHTQKIERRSKHSFSIVRYKPERGPFPFPEGDKSVTMSVPSSSATEGDGIVNASKKIFVPTDVGRLIRLFHYKQVSSRPLNDNETYTDPIRIAGLKTSGTGSGGSGGGGAPSVFGGRTLQVGFVGTWTGTLTLQRTYDPDGITDWQDERTFTSPGSTAVQDERDNVIAYYRLGFTGNNWGSGTAICTLTCEIGGGHGVSEIVEYVTPTQVLVQTQKPFVHRFNAQNWRMSEWEAPDRHPSANIIHESRFFLGGQGRIWGSGSDAYQVFDFDEIGDAATISRTIGRGPSQDINWMLSGPRLMVGTDYGVITIRSNAFDAPLTAQDFLIRYPSTDGTAPIRAVQIDEGAIFIQRSNRRIYGMFIPQGGQEHTPIDLTVLNPDIGNAGFSDLAIQRQLDTHIRAVRKDGQGVNLLFDKLEQARAFWRVQTDGLIENIAVLPGQREDQVYVGVARTINGVTKRSLEKFARLDECVGGTLCKLLDSHIVYQGVATTTLSVPHLIGRQVAVWADGSEVGFDRTSPGTVHTFLVDGSGNITLPVAVSNAVVGLAYTATFVSAKLAYAARDGQPINKKKRVHQVGFILNNTHMQGVQYGHWHRDPAESRLDNLPLIERGASVASGKIWESYDQEMIPMAGEWDTDSRIQIKGLAPRPATVLGVTMELTTTS